MTLSQPRPWTAKSNAGHGFTCLQCYCNVSFTAFWHPKDTVPNCIRSAFLLLLGCWSALAQIDRSALTGTVMDQTGGLVSGVAIQVARPGDGLVRNATTGPAGSYAVLDLPVGNYELTFSKPGFATVRYVDVVQTIGLTRTLDAVIGVAVQEQTLTVSESISQLDRTTASVGARTERRQADELPLNGRNWYSMTSLAPGAVDSGGSNMKSVRFAGHALDDNNFTLDGVDATGVINQAQRGQGRMTIPVDSIAEFRVEAALYSTELGGSPGGQVSITSPSGTNAIRGALYDYFRNDKLNTRSPLDPAKAPPFRLNQFGGSLGGPLHKNRTFYYANYEGYEQRLGQTVTGFVPTEAFRASVAPSVAAVVAAFPRGNGAQVDPSTVTYQFLGRQAVEENTGMLRLDHRFSGRLTGFLRYNQDEAVSSVPTGAIGITQSVDTQPKNGVAQLLQLFTPNLTNESKFGFNQAITHTRTLSPLAYTVAITGFSSITNGNTKDERGTTLSWIDNASWVAGRNIVKAGAEVRYVEMNQGSSFTGTLSYLTPALFASNTLDKATQTSTLPMKHERKTQVFTFLQDEYKVRSNVTLNLGLRYEFYGVFRELDNRAIPFDFATCGPVGYCPAGSPFNFPNRLNLDPRGSISWAPEVLSGNTVFRAGAGIYHGDGQLDDQNLPASNDVPRYSLTRATFPTLSYPINSFLAQSTGIVTPRMLNRKDQYSSEWGISVQQRMGGAIASVGYLASKGTHVLSTSYVNTLIPGTAVRPYPAFGIVEYRGNDSNTSFQGMHASAQRYFRRGLLFSANYLWSHSINDGATGGGEAVFPQNVQCRACDRASSDQDVRQVFNANWVWEIPLHSKLLSNWELSGVASARSGLPVNVTVDRGTGDLVDGYNTNQRPNLVSGVSVVPSAGPTPGRWINAAAFAVPAKGLWGNAGRNLVRAPGAWQADAALSRQFSLRERTRLQVRVEGFNLFNRAQYGAPAANISASSTFGRITTLVNNGPVGSGTPRQLQLALRLSF